MIAPPPASTTPSGQQRLDPRPGRIGQLARAHHRSMINDRGLDHLQDTPKSPRGWFSLDTPHGV
jgi:hypothetical protein